MKSYRLVRQSQVQTVLSPDDAERMLATGDWLIATVKPRTRSAARMRGLRRARRLADWHYLTMWIAPEDLAAVKAAQRPGETYAELLMRLVRERGLLE